MSQGAQLSTGVDDDPGAVAIESQILLDAKRDLDGDIRILWRYVGDRSDGDLLVCAAFGIRVIDGKNNRARPIFSALDLPSFLFFLPEIRSRK